MSLTVEKCIEGWTNSLKQMNVKADIVFLGDSLTYYGDFSTVFPDKVVCNLGLRGDTIDGIINRVGQVLIMQPEEIYLMAGINDVANSSVMEFETKYSTLISRLIQTLPHTKITVQSLLPVNNEHFSISCNNNQIENCNAIIKKIAKNYNIHYLDIYSHYIEKSQLPVRFTNDGIHLTPEAYHIWYGLIRSKSEY